MKNVIKSLEIMEKELAKVKQALAGDITEAVDTASAPDLDNLDSLKPAELRKIADDAGIEYAKKATAKTLREAIIAFYEGEEEDEEEEDDADEEEEDEEDEDDSDDDEDEDDEEGEEYDEESLDELDDDELVEVAEEFELDPEEFQKGKGKKKKLDRKALIEAILEAQEEAEEDDEDEDEDEDESDEDNLEFLEDEELEELSTEELQAHYNELAEYMDEEDIEIPKAGKLKKNAKDAQIRKAIVALYDAIEEAEEDEE